MLFRLGGDLVAVLDDLGLDHLDDVDLAHVGRDLPARAASQDREQGSVLV